MTKFRTLVTVFFFSLLTIQLFASGSPATITRGQSQKISWNVAGAANCTPGFSGTEYPLSAGDGIYNAWKFPGTQPAGTGSVTYAFYAVGSYTFKCTSGSVADTAQITINDCPNNQAWNGSSCQFCTGKLWQCLRASHL